MEVKDFLEKNVNIDISKQGYLQQRQKLNYEVFSYLNQVYLADYYFNLEDSDLFHTYLVCAIDGSKAEILASKENQKTFGETDNGVLRYLSAA